MNRVDEVEDLLAKGKLRITGDEILIRIRRTPRKTASGRIFLPETARENTQAGVVVINGTDLHLSAGDVVVYTNYRGRSLLSSSDKYWLLKAEDVLGKVEEGDIDEEA